MSALEEKIIAAAIERFRYQKWREQCKKGIYPFATRDKLPSEVHGYKGNI
jgi:post-segregation antitoxin (ccd killing protein)